MSSAGMGGLLRRCRREEFRGRVGDMGSLAASTAFALYNGIAGLAYRAPWNGSICVYYLLLAGIRGCLLVSRRKLAGLPRSEAHRLEKRTCATAAGALLILNLALIAPIALMARMERPVNMGLIPAIATATYAAWKITLASIRYRRRNHSADGFTAQLRTVGLVDALVSVLTLQNTLIMVKDEGGERSMLTLAALSSAVIFIGIVAISVANWRQQNRYVPSGTVSKNKQS